MVWVGGWGGGGSISTDDMMGVSEHGYFFLCKQPRLPPLPHTHMQSLSPANCASCSGLGAGAPGSDDRLVRRRDLQSLFVLPIPIQYNDTPVPEPENVRARVGGGEGRVSVSGWRASCAKVQSRRGGGMHRSRERRRPARNSTLCPPTLCLRLGPATPAQLLIAGWGLENKMWDLIMELDHGPCASQRPVSAHSRCAPRRASPTAHRPSPRHTTPAPGVTPLSLGSTITLANDHAFPPGYFGARAPLLPPSQQQQQQ